MIILDLSPFPKILKPGGHYLLVLLIIDLRPSFAVIVPTQIDEVRVAILTATWIN